MVSQLRKTEEAEKDARNFKALYEDGHLVPLVISAFYCVVPAQGLIVLEDIDAGQQPLMQENNLR